MRLWNYQAKKSNNIAVSPNISYHAEHMRTFRPLARRGKASISHWDFATYCAGSFRRYALSGWQKFLGQLYTIASQKTCRFISSIVFPFLKLLHRDGIGLVYPTKRELVGGLERPILDIIVTDNDSPSYEMEEPREERYGVYHELSMGMIMNYESLYL